MVMALYEKYKIDFEMFGYEIVDFFKYATDSEGLMPDVIETAVKKEDVDEEEAEEMQTEMASNI